MKSPKTILKRLIRPAALTSLGFGMLAFAWLKWVAVPTWLVPLGAGLVLAGTAWWFLSVVLGIVPSNMNL